MPRTFGAVIRAERTKRGFGLRQFAKTIGLSPTYLSKIERDEFGPPAEDKVVTIAKLLDLDPDEMLALAGKVASDVQDLIRRHPQEMASFLRSTKGWSAEEMSRLAKNAARRRKR